MNRKSAIKSIIIFLTVFTLLSSSIGLASTLNPDPLFSMEEIRQITNGTDTGANKALDVKIQVARPGDLATLGWSNEIKVFTGEIVRFRTRIKNNVNYDLQDVNIISVLPPQDTLSLLESSIFTSKVSTHQIIENNLVSTFNKLEIGESLYIEYDMLALVETSVEGVQSTVATASNINSKYYDELELMKEEYTQKTNQLELINIEIEDNQIIYADSLDEIESINADIAVANEQISNLEAQITSLDTELQALNSELDGINADILDLTASIESVDLEISSVTNQIAEQQLAIQDIENTITQQTQLVQTLEQDLYDVNLEIESTLESSDANQEYVQGLIDAQSSLEAEIAQINLNIDAAQAELATAQAELDAMIALQNQLTTEINELNIQIEQETQTLQNTQELYSSTSQQLETAESDLALATQSLTNLEANILSVTQQLESAIAQESDLAAQELQINQALQADIDTIALKTNQLSQLQADLQIANQDLSEVIDSINVKTLSLQDIQNSIQQTTQNINNLISLENDLLTQEATAQQLLQSTITSLDQEQQVLVQLQNQLNTLESQLATATADLTTASDSLASVQAEIQLTTQQIAENTAAYEQLMTQQAETDQLIQDAIAQISATTSSLEQKQLLYADLTQQIEDANILLQTKQTNLQNTLNEISAQGSLLLQNQNTLASLQTSLATAQDEYNLLNQQLQQEIANQQLNSQELTDKQLAIQQQEVVVADLQNQIYASQDMQTDLQSDINSLTVQYNQLTQSIGIANTQINLKTQQADGLALQIQNYGSTLLNLEQTLTADQFSLETVNQQIVDSQGLLAAQNDLITNLQTDLATEQANLDDLNALLDAELAAQQVGSQELTDLENQIDTQTAIVTGLQTDIADSQDLQATLQQGVTSDTMLINQLEQNIADTESTINLKTQQMPILQADLADVESDIYLQEEAISQKQLISDDLGEQIDILDSEIDTKNIEIEENQVLIDEKDIQISGESENYATLQDQKTMEETHLTELQGELSVLMMEPEKNAAEIEEKEIEIDTSQVLISDYNHQITVSEQTIQTYLVEKDGLVNTQKSLQKSYDNLVIRRDEKQVEKSGVDTIIGGMNDDLQTLNDAKSLIEADILTLTNDISDLNDDLATYQQSLSDTNAALATKQTDLDTTATLIATLEQDLILEQQTLQQLNQEYQTLLAELSENNDVINNYLTQISTSEDAIDSYNSQIQAAIADKTVIQNNLDQQNIQASSLNNAISSTSEQISIVTAQKQQAELQLQSLEDEILALQQTVADTQSSQQSVSDSIALKQSLLADEISLEESLQISLANEQGVLDQLTLEYNQVLSDLSQNNEEINALMSSVSDKSTEIGQIQTDISNIQVSISSIQTTLYNLNLDKQLYQDEISSTTQQITLLESQQSQASTAIISLQAELDSLNTDKTYYETLSADISAQINTNRQEHNTLQGDLATLNIQEQGYVDEKTAIQTQITDYQDQIATIQSQIITQEDLIATLSLDKQTHEQEIADIQSQLAANQQNQADMQTTLDQALIDEQTLSNEIAMLQTEKTSLEESIAQIELQITTLNTDIAALYESKAYSEAELANVQSLQEANYETKINLQSSLDTLSQQHDQALVEISSLEASIDAYNLQIPQIESEISSIQASIAELNTLKTTKEGELNNLEITNAQQIVADKNTYIAEQEQNRAAKETELSTASAELDAALENVNQDQQILDSLLQEKSSIETQIAQNTHILQTSQNDLVNANDDLASLTALKDSKIELKQTLNLQLTHQQSSASDLQIQINEHSDSLQTIQESYNTYDTELSDLNALLQSNTLLAENTYIQIQELESEQISYQQEVETLATDIQTYEQSMQDVNLMQQQAVTVHILTNPDDVDALLRVEKEVFDEDTNSWSETTAVEEEEIVKFRIIVENIGTVNFTKLTITDILPTNILSYYGNAIYRKNILDSSSYFNGTVYEPENNQGVLKWTFESLYIGEDIVLEFDALGINSGVEDNVAEAEGGFLITGVTEEFSSVTDDTANVKVLDTPENSLPIANDDFFDISKDSVDNELNVLENDNDPDPDDEIRIEQVSDPENGTLTYTDDFIYYTPNTGFVGEDHFRYMIIDNSEDKDVAEVYLNILETNHPPVANDDYYNVLEDSTENLLDVLENDTDQDPVDTVKIEQVFDPENGTITYSQDYVYYTPNPGFVGQDSFDYMISDNSEEKDVATVYINILEINHPPVANDDYYNVLEDSTDNTLDVLSNDSDEDEDSLSLVSIDSGPYNGNAYINGDNILYAPAENYSGTDTFVYIISDGLEQDTAEATIYVENINDNPVAVDDNSQTPVNTSIEITVLENDYDVDEDTLTIEEIEVQPLHGEVSINSDFINYTPDTGYNGSDSFVYKISDGNGAYSTAIVNIDVYVMQINHPPVAVDDMESVVENSTDNSINVLINDYDVDPEDIVSLNKIETQPNNGTVEIDGNLIKYTPQIGFVGTDVFSYNITDGNDHYDIGEVTVIVEEEPPSIIKKPEHGVFYLWDSPIFEIGAFLDGVDYETLIIGPITLEVEVNESEYFPVEKVEYYLNDELLGNTTEDHLFMINELLFNITTIKIIAYGEEQQVTEEIEAFMINFGFFIDDQSLEE